MTAYEQMSQKLKQSGINYTNKYFESDETYMISLMGREDYFVFVFDKNGNLTKILEG